MRGAELISGFLEGSSFARRLGIELRSIEDDHAVLVLPYADEELTIGDVVPGGPVSALIDTAAMAAAWSTIEFDRNPPPCMTVGLSVDFPAPAWAAQALVADAHVLRRGSTLCFCEVKVSGDSDDSLVATGLVTYKLG
jgi:uncharacterized protein (TIGR00369 family)